MGAKLLSQLLGLGQFLLCFAKSLIHFYKFVHSNLKLLLFGHSLLFRTLVFRVQRSKLYNQACQFKMQLQPSSLVQFSMYGWADSFIYLFSYFHRQICNIKAGWILPTVSITYFSLAWIKSPCLVVNWSLTSLCSHYELQNLMKATLQPFLQLLSIISVISQWWSANQLQARSKLINA